MCTLQRIFPTHAGERAAVLVLREHSDQRRVEADLRIELGPLGPTVVSYQAARTPDLAIKAWSNTSSADWNGGCRSSTGGSSSSGGSSRNRSAPEEAGDTLAMADCGGWHEGECTQEYGCD
jgi:hypothetical protein